MDGKKGGRRGRESDEWRKREREKGEGMGGEREWGITRKTGRQILFCLLGKPASRLMGSERREKVRGGRGRGDANSRKTRRGNA